MDNEPHDEHLMDQGRKPEVSLIIPTWNERPCLPRVLDGCRAALSGKMYEVIVVDDDSPDGTWRWVQDLARRDSAVRLIRRSGRRGLATAVVEGFEEARGRKLIVMDGDGQHDPGALVLLLRMLDGVDLAIASRYYPGGSVGSWNLARRWASRATTRLARAWLDLPLWDPLSGFFALRRDVLMPVLPKLKPAGYKILLEVYCRLRARGSPPRYAEIPVDFRQRLAGRNKASLQVLIDFGKQIVRLRREGKESRVPVLRRPRLRRLRAVTDRAGAGIMEPALRPSADDGGSERQSQGVTHAV